MFRNISRFNVMTKQRDPVAKFLNKSKGDQCLLKYSQLFSKVINASSNILKGDQCLLKYSDLLVRGRRLQRALHQDLPGQDLNHHLLIINHYRHHQ